MFALVDGNNFYASCERVFNPALNNKPVVVLSNNDGCVIARSNEAKELGIPMGAAAFELKSFFQQHAVVVKSSNYSLYGDMSRRMVNILSQFTPDIEIYSIDESFLQFKGFERFNLNEIGREMHKRVLKWIGIPTSIGLAETKTLAKVANRIAKKYAHETQSVYAIDTEEKRVKALKWLKIEDVWGIGRQFSKKLKAIGVHTAYAFTQLTDAYVRNEFTVIGLRIKKELEGQSVLALEEVQTKKNIATTRSFDQLLSSSYEIEERISTFAVTCAEKLRKQNSLCSHLMVFAHTNYFRKDLPQYNRSVLVQLPFPTDSSITISKYALKGFREIFREGFQYKKAGVVLGDLSSNVHYQLNVFENENPKHQNLMKVMDQLNQKYGTKKLKLASQDPSRTWKMRQQYLSPNYSTKMTDIIKIIV